MHMLDSLIASKPNTREPHCWRTLMRKREWRQSIWFQGEMRNTSPFEGETCGPDSAQVLTWFHFLIAGGAGLNAQFLMWGPCSIKDPMTLRHAIQGQYLTIDPEPREPTEPHP